MPHHPQKIALILAAMRKFAAMGCEAAWLAGGCIRALDDAGNSQTISGEIVAAGGGDGGCVGGAGDEAGGVAGDRGCWMALPLPVTHAGG